MADSVAQDRIRAYVDRILRMKEEEKAIKADIREIYAEAKGDGFDKTILGKFVNYVEKRDADRNAVMEADAIFDLYLEAYDGRVGTKVATHVHAHEATSEHDADGVITEPQSAPQAASDLTANPAPSVNSRQVEPTQPETANDIPATNDGGRDEDDLSEPEPVSDRRRHHTSATQEIVHGLEADHRPVIVSEEPVRSIASEAISTPIPEQITRPGPAHPACRKPDLCGPYSHDGLCQRCAAAHAEAVQ